MFNMPDESKMANKQELLAALIQVARDNNMLEIREEVFKDHPKIMINCISYLEPRTLLKLQLVCKKFYKTFVPKLMSPYNSIKAGDLQDYFFSTQQIVLQTTAISHVTLINKDYMLVSVDNIRNEIYKYSTCYSEPYKRVWRHHFTLKEAPYLEIKKSHVGTTKMVVTGQDYRIQLYQIVDSEEFKQFDFICEETFLSYEVQAVCITRNEHHIVMGHQGGVFTLWDISTGKSIVKLDFYQGIGTGNINHLVQTFKEVEDEFASACEKGVHFIMIRKGRLIQNVSEKFFKDEAISKVQNLAMMKWLVFPKWNKIITQVQIHEDQRRKGTIYALREAEWTKGSVQLQGFDTNVEDWHVGISGSNLLLSELVGQRSYVLVSGKEFNLWCDLQVVQDKDPTRRRYTIYYITFDEVTTFQDQLWRADLNFAFLDTDHITPTEKRFVK